eukprot:6496437-Alexandrium_andersonii.AAC.1
MLSPILTATTGTIAQLHPGMVASPLLPAGLIARACVAEVRTGGALHLHTPGDGAELRVRWPGC